MAAKKQKELSEKETPALTEELGNLRRKQFELRTQTVTEKVEDTSQHKKHRRQIARILTALHQRNSTAAAKA